MLAALATGSASAAVPRQVGSLKYTTTKPGAPTGLVLHFDFQNPDDPGGKPHAVTTLVVHAPDGGRIDTSVPPRCEATDLELMLQGPDACPPESKIGDAYAISDTGGRDPFPRYTRTNISEFNEATGIVAVGVNEDLPFVKPVDHTRIEGGRTTTHFPTVPGAPPPEPQAAFRKLHFENRPYVRDGRPYNHTPAKCPKAGYWRMVLEFTYADGVTETVNSDSPCRRPKPKRKKHRPHG